MNLIFSAFATLAGYRENADANRGTAAYYRCLVVALASAKAQNPGCCVALVTNAPVPAPFDAQLAAAGCEVWACPFDTFRYPADLPWSLAFYKLCALGWVLENKGFDRLAMVDCDTYTQYPLDDLFREAAEAVLLYQVPHPASQPMAAAISRCCDAAWPAGAPHALAHYGGELVAGPAGLLRRFLALCAEADAALRAAGTLPQDGDEVLLCLAAWRAAQTGLPVRGANAYICRYWLGARHYLVSTNYCLTPVCILHLPGAGKDRQLKLLYRRWARRGAFPKREDVWRLCGFPPARPPLLRTTWVRLCAALGR